MDRATRLDDCERRFRRAGLPLLSEDFSAREDVFNRAFPLLALVLLAELVAALDVDWAWWANAAAVLGALAVTLAAVPLLLIFALVLFVNAEMWQVFADRSDATLAAVGLLPATGAGAGVTRRPRSAAARAARRR